MTRDEQMAVLQMGREIRSAAWDAFLLSFLFGLMAVPNLNTGTAEGYMVGGIQLLASFLNFSAGIKRRRMVTITERTEE
jgi:hypothetical protein